MKYLIALVTASCLIAGMFAFQTQMMRRVTAWEAENATISPIETTLVRIAYGITNYSYALVALIIVASAAMAALISKQRSDEQFRHGD